MEKQAKHRKQAISKKRSPVNSPTRPVPREKQEKPATDSEAAASPEQTTAVNAEQETTAQQKEWERQPRVNADEQKNIVNNPEHSQQEVTDQGDK